MEYKGENILNFLAVHDKELSLDNMRIQDEIWYTYLSTTSMYNKQDCSELVEDSSASTGVL